MPKRKPIRHAGFLIHKLRGASREKPYLVDLRTCPLKEGEPKRPCFATLEQAKAKCAEVADAIAANGQSAFDLSERDRLDAKDALKALDGRCTMAEAARFWTKYHPAQGAVTFADVLAKYRADMEARKVRPATLRGLWRLERIGRELGKRAMCGITSAELSDWLDGRGFNGTNRNNYRLALSGLFGFATDKGIVSINPVGAKTVPLVKVEETPVTIWTAEQVGLLLHTAEAVKPDLVPLLAIMALGGLRPAEAEALRWESVNIAEKIIRVEGATSKTRARRIVPVSDNLAAWLVKNRRKAGPIAPRPQTVRRWRERIAAAVLVPDWRERLAKAGTLKPKEREAAGLTWAAIVVAARKVRKELQPADVLRHSFASHWLASHHDENKLASIMGNSPSVVHRHYKALVSEAEARPYWSIMPSAAAKIIPMNAAAVA